MKQLITINEYLKTRYKEGSQPCKRTIIRLILEGKLPGRKQGRYYYIDVEAELRTTCNPLADRVLGI
jgi:hypothetical protein